MSKAARAKRKPREETRLSRLTAAEAPIRHPTLRQVERALGEPAHTWAARCYEIASRIVERGLVTGSAVYGHWTGPIHHRSRFATKAGVGFCQHGSIVLPDGRVLDPTRWVFEARVPYLYVGPADHYDEGGNGVREAMSPEAMPPYVKDRDYPLTLRALRDTRALTFVRGLLPPGSPLSRIGRAQLFWLANRPPRTLDGHAKAIFAWLTRAGRSEMIPIDNRRMVEEGRA